MATQNNRKLAAPNRENCGEHPRSSLSQNSNVPRSQEDYIVQVSEEVEGRVTKRLSIEFSKTENRILGALARLGDFLMNPLLQGHSGTTPEPSQNALSTSQGTNENDSQNGLHPEAGLFHSQLTENSGPKDGHDMVTGAKEQNRSCNDMTEVHEEVNQLTEDDRINYFHSFMRGDALQTFKSINGPTRENLGEILAIFRRKYVKPQSMATAKHKIQKLVFNPANQNLVDFLGELQKLAKNAFGIAAHAIIEQFKYAKRPPHLKKSINQATWQKADTKKKCYTVKKELELFALESPDELQINTVSHNNANANVDRPKATCHHCKKLGHYRN